MSLADKSSILKNIRYKRLVKPSTKSFLSTTSTSSYSPSPVLGNETTSLLKEVPSFIMTGSLRKGSSYFQPNGFPAVGLAGTLTATSYEAFIGSGTSNLDGVSQAATRTPDPVATITPTPTITPTSTPTPTETSTPAPTETITPTPLEATATPTPIPPVNPTVTPITIETSTPTPLAATPTPTSTTIYGVGVRFTRTNVSFTHNLNAYYSTDGTNWNFIGVVNNNTSYSNLFTVPAGTNLWLGIQDTSGNDVVFGTSFGNPTQYCGLSNAFNYGIVSSTIASSTNPIWCYNPSGPLELC